MKTLKQFMESKKSCPQGQYYCYTDKKCKKLPVGYHMGRGGYLAKDNDDSSDAVSYTHLTLPTIYSV